MTLPPAFTNFRIYAFKPKLFFTHKSLEDVVNIPKSGFLYQKDFHPCFFFFFGISTQKLSHKKVIAAFLSY